MTVTCPGIRSLTLARSQACQIVLKIAATGILGVILVFILSSRALSQGPANTIPNPPGPTATRPIPDELNFANGLYRDRRYDLAAEEYERFLNKVNAGTDADNARYGLANSLLFLGKYQEAKPVFQRFIELAPQHEFAATGLYRIGETSYLLGELTAARSALERFTAGNPGHKHSETAWSHLGDIYLRSNDFIRARTAYQNVLKTATGSLLSRSLLGLGRVHAALGENDQALARMKELADSGGPEWADRALLEMGMLEFKLEHLEKSVAAFESLEKRFPRSPLVSEAQYRRALSLEKLGRIAQADLVLKQLSSSGSPRVGVQAADALGISLASRGKVDESLKLFDEAMAQYARTAQTSLLCFHAAEVAQQAGRRSDALARYSNLLTLEPAGSFSETACLRAAGLALDTKQFPEAKALLDRFTKTFPASKARTEADLIRARLQLAQGDAGSAVRILEELMLKPVPDEAVRYYLGFAYRANGQTEKAVGLLTELSKVSSTATAIDAKFLLGQTYVEEGKFAEAVPLLESFLKITPKGELAEFATAHLMHCQVELGQREKAHLTLKQLRTQFPGSRTIPTAVLRLAESEMSAKDTARAIELFSTIADTPDLSLRARALSGLGWARLQSGDPNGAAETFEKLVAVAPKNPLAANAALARGKALEQAGEKAAALRAYEDLVKHSLSPEATGRAMLSQARLLCEEKRPNDAAKVFESLLKTDWKSSGETADTLLAEWGWSLVDGGKAEEADQVFSRLLKEHPTSLRAADARFNLAESAFAKGNFAEVVSLLEPVLASSAKVAPSMMESAIYRVSRAQIELKEWDKAARSLERLTKDFPHGTYDREARFWQAEVAFGSGDASKAEGLFAALMLEKSGPKEPPALRVACSRRRAECLVQLERWNDVLSVTDKFKTDFPEDPDLAQVTYLRGRALQAQAHFEEARAAYAEVIGRRQGSDLAALAQFMRGECYFHEKTYREALREFLKVDYLYNSPEWQSAALLEAGKVHEQLSQWTEAAETYERLRSKFPATGNATKAQDRLVAVRKRLATATEPSARQ